MRVSLLTVVIVSGCGEAMVGPVVAVDGGPLAGDAGVPDAGEVDLPRWRPEEDAERLARSECAWHRRCAPSLFARQGWDDEGCVFARRDARSETLVRRAQLVADGRATFDRDRFERCVAAYRAGGCAPITCEDFFPGLASLGAACSDSDECGDDGAFCTGEAGAMCGACVLAKPGFEPCALDVECASGRCAQRCLPPVGEGDLCDKECTFGLCCPGSCVGFGMGSGVCHRKAGLGEDCDRGEASAPRCDEHLGLTCVDGRCGSVDLAQLGERCDSSCWCADGHSCLGNVCQPWPRSGEPCDGRCRGDDVCLRGHCQQAPREGEPCVLDENCAPDLVCRGALGARTCRVRSWLACE